jgi:putative peptidoglycan lipid II flippase
MRGAFDAEAVRRSANVLQAYGLGLIPMVLIRSAVATFQSRGDTRTPMLCFFGGLAINLTLKLTLSPDLGVVGLALGTAAGAWINFGLLILIGRLRGLSLSEDRLYENIVLMLFSAAGAALATPLLLSAAETLARGLPFLRNEFIVVATFGGLSLAYGALFALATTVFGRSVRRQLF